MDEILAGAHTQRSSVPLSLARRSETIQPEIRTRNFAEVYEAVEQLDNLRLPSPPSVRTLSDLNFEGSSMVEVPDLGRLYMTDWVKRRIGGMMGVKWHKFFDPMDPGVVQKAIQSHLGGLGDECPRVKLVARQLLPTEAYEADGILRGAVSPSYSEFRDLDALSRLYDVGEEALESDWGFSDVRLLDNGSHFTLILKEPFALLPGSNDMGYVGLKLRNSEVGAHSWTGSLIIIRLVCINGMMVVFVDTTYFRFVHKGLLLERVNEPIEAALDRCYEVVQEIPKYNERLLNHKISEPTKHLTAFLEGRGMRNVMRQAILDAYELEDIEGDNSYRALQAISRLSPALAQDPNRQREIEQLAGDYAQHALALAA